MRRRRFRRSRKRIRSTNSRWGGCSTRSWILAGKADSTEEFMQDGNYTQDDQEEALAVVQDFDPIGVGTRDLRECLLLQLKAFDPQNALAHQVVSEHLKQVQSNQLKEIAR